jgi:protein-arginine kinase activator protein McsA
MCDKPMECNKCKRNAVVHYKEMQDGKVNSYHMCKSCPLLKDKLQVEDPALEFTPSVFSKEGKICPLCGLTKDEFLITLTLGCDLCAETFKDILSKELILQDLVPSNVQNCTDLNALHFGNIPKNRRDQTFIKTLETLHVALNEAVSSEHFEEAADIYAQIQKYLENPNAGTK